MLYHGSIFRKEEIMQNRTLRLVLLTGFIAAPALAFAADSPPAGPDHFHGPAMRGGIGGPRILDLAFSALDTNKDGKISKDEFEANRPERMKTADANSDGKVTKKEFEDFIVKQARERADRMFAKMDTNKDGRLDDADAKMVADERFDRVDANHDGYITKDEFGPRRAAMARRGGHFRGHGPERGLRDDGPDDNGSTTQ